jgi:hypothetical protein
MVSMSPRPRSDSYSKQAKLIADPVYASAQKIVCNFFSIRVLLGCSAVPCLIHNLI